MKRFIKGLAKGIWGQVAGKFLDAVFFAAGIGYLFFSYGFSWGRLIEGRWQALVVGIWTIAAVVIRHSFSAAYVVTREIKIESAQARTQKSLILSSAGVPVELTTVRYSQPKLKLYGTAMLLTLLMFALSYFAWKQWGSHPVTAFTAQNPAVEQSRSLDNPVAIIYVPRLELSPPKVGNPMTLIPYCENAGSQTAFEVGQISNVTAVDVDDVANPGYISPAKTDWIYKNWPHPRGLGLSTVPPGKCTHIWLVGEKLTRELKTQLDGGTKILVWVGFSSWRDERGEFKYEQCYWRRPNGEWAICENHNGIKPLVEKSASEQPPTTPENVEARIQEWSNGMGIVVTDVSGEFSDSIFAVHLVLSNGTSLIVTQPKLQDQYLVIHVEIAIVESDQRSSFIKLSARQRADLLRNIVIEMNRLRIECIVHPTVNDAVELQKTLLITSATNEAFLNALQDMNSAVALAEAVIQKGLQQPSGK